MEKSAQERKTKTRSRAASGRRAHVRRASRWRCPRRPTSPPKLHVKFQRVNFLRVDSLYVNSRLRVGESTRTTRRLRQSTRAITEISDAQHTNTPLNEGVRGDRHVATARSHRNGVNLSVWYWSGDLFSRDRFLSDCVGNHSRAD